MAILSFKGWLDQQEDGLQAIQEELECDRLEAVKIWLLMRISGDLYEAEGWEDPDA